MEREEVIKLMESSKSKEEWDANCDKVKAACNGYPTFWYSEIAASGLARRVTNSFGSDADIHISGIRR